MKKPLIYIAAPLFCDAELKYNQEIKSFILDMVYDVFLPQEEAGLVSDYVLKGTGINIVRKQIFKTNLDAIMKADIILIVLDGRVPDEGACLEAGIGYALGKECIGLKTDSRSLQFGVNNLMIDGIIKNRVAPSLEKLKVLLDDLRVELSSKEGK